MIGCAVAGRVSGDAYGASERVFGYARAIKDHKCAGLVMTHTIERDDRAVTVTDWEVAEGGEQRAESRNAMTQEL